MDPSACQLSHLRQHRSGETSKILSKASGQTILKDSASVLFRNRFIETCAVGHGTSVLLGGDASLHGASCGCGDGWLNLGWVSSQKNVVSTADGTSEQSFIH